MSQTQFHKGGTGILPVLQTTRTWARRPGHSRGFTLLELLVTLVIMGVITGALFASLRVAFQAGKRVNQTLDNVQRTGVAGDFLRRDIESALLPTGTLANAFIGTDERNDRGGDGDTLLLCAPVDGPPTVTLAADIRQIEYLLVTEGSERLLVRRVTTNLLASATISTDEADDEILCRGVLSLNFRYFDGSEWYTTWDSTQEASLIGPQQGQSLPLAVEVTLELEPTSTQSEPVLITRVFMLSCAVPASPDTTGQTTGVLP